jgi:hypothetical protein
VNYVGRLLFQCWQHLHCSSEVHTLHSLQFTCCTCYNCWSYWPENLYICTPRSDDLTDLVWSDSSLGRPKSAIITRLDLTNSVWHCCCHLISCNHWRYWPETLYICTLRSADLGDQISVRNLQLGRRKSVQMEPKSRNCCLATWNSSTRRQCTLLRQDCQSRTWASSTRQQY